MAGHRALLVLGTASKSPTRARHHNAHVLRWDDQLVLLDPGEAAQSQLVRGGVKASSIDQVCLTHLHGDHCLGLPGFIQRRANDGVRRPLHLHYPAESEGHLRHLLDGTEDTVELDLHLHPCGPGTTTFDTGAFRVVARGLDHTVPAVGWRLEEPARRHLLAGRLEALGIGGRDVGRLQRAGSLEVGGRRVTVEELSEVVAGQTFAFVMDTRWCDAALELAHGADLLVCESTFRTGEEDLADAYGHLTAGQAGRLAREAGARRLVLGHYSQRHPDTAGFEADAKAEFDDVIAAQDLTWVDVPPRR